MTIVFATDRLTLHAGDCLDIMPTLAAGTVDAIVTDPPYGIGFMGHTWDQPGEAAPVRAGAGHSAGHPRERAEPVGVTSMEAGRYDQGPLARRRFQAWCESWGRECLRLARPGAWLLAFGSPRGHHRMAVGLEDAGWEITDEVQWLFAQGMPKGRTTLKPAHEPIILARRPSRPARPLNIDETRIPGADGDADGRWPANVVLTDPVLDGGWEGVVGGGNQSGGGYPRWRSDEAAAGSYGGYAGGETGRVPADTAGSYSRFFLVPKANKRERNAGLEATDEQSILWSDPARASGDLYARSATTGGSSAWSSWRQRCRPADGLTEGGVRRRGKARNHHPTVKPVELMDHLVRLVVPVGGLVLDPFLGSGSTAIAAIGSGRRCIGIERDESYLALVPKRLRLLVGDQVAEVPA